MNPKVDWFFDEASPWQKEYRRLRQVILQSGLSEELKWGCPCYTHEGVNVVLMHGFKEYCALLFIKGALFKDPAGLLVQQTKNVQSARHLRFTSLAEVNRRTSAIKGYLRQAIAVEKAGLKVKWKTTSDYEVPAEFAEQLKANPKLNAAFTALTPGRQRGYLYFFSQAKQSKTRAARVAKCIPQILKGKGRDD